MLLLDACVLVVLSGSWNILLVLLVFFVIMIFLLGYAYA